MYTFIFRRRLIYQKEIDLFFKRIWSKKPLEAVFYPKFSPNFYSVDGTTIYLNIVYIWSVKTKKNQNIKYIICFSLTIFAVCYISFCVVKFYHFNNQEW